MKLVYVAGPFRGANSWEMECNIRRAEELSLEVWRMGAVALCPHLNTRFFQGALEDSTWLLGDLEMVKRCDAVLLTPDWQRSRGACGERSEALANGLPVFETLDSLRQWVQPATIETQGPIPGEKFDAEGDDANGMSSKNCSCRMCVDVRSDLVRSGKCGICGTKASDICGVGLVCPNLKCEVVAIS